MPRKKTDEMDWEAPRRKRAKKKVTVQDSDDDDDDLAIIPASSSYLRTGLAATVLTGAAAALVKTLAAHGYLDAAAARQMVATGLEQLPGMPSMSGLNLARDAVLGPMEARLEQSIEAKAMAAVAGLEAVAAEHHQQLAGQVGEHAAAGQALTARHDALAGIVNAHSEAGQELTQDLQRLNVESRDSFGHAAVAVDELREGIGVLNQVALENQTTGAQARADLDMLIGMLRQQGIIG